jgi:hypothetical protein
MFEAAAIMFFSPIVKMLGISGLIAAACIALWFLAPAWLPINRTRLLEIAAVAMFCGFYSLYWFRQGENTMAAMIAAKDRAAIARANEALKSVDDCEKSGGTWHVESGSCSR